VLPPENTSLHERPISGTGSVDLVIYAAQLSQSFFSCLANAVEGFMDLFLSAAASNEPGNDKTDFSLDQSSIHSDLQSVRLLPAGALASIVLWCDAELAKFAAAFGGTRILGNLALSPPPREPKPKGPRVVGSPKETPNGNKDREVRISRRGAFALLTTDLFSSSNLGRLRLLAISFVYAARRRLRSQHSALAKRFSMHPRTLTLLVYL
jgi:hypothetical protein